MADLDLLDVTESGNVMVRGVNRTVVEDAPQVLLGFLFGDDPAGDARDRFLFLTPEEARDVALRLIDEADAAEAQQRPIRPDERA